MSIFLQNPFNTLCSNYLKKFKLLLWIGLLVGLTNTSCKEKEFIFDLDNLLLTAWGIPQIVEAGMEPIDLDAPTIFTADGLVTIGGARNDFWYTRGERTIILEQAKEQWFIIDLSSDRLYVEKTRHPEGTFMVKCLYEPIK